jgi:hypothetical protein
MLQGCASSILQKTVIWYLCTKLCVLRYLSGQFDISVHECSSKAPLVNLYLTFLGPICCKIFLSFTSYPSTSTSYKLCCIPTYLEVCMYLMYAAGRRLASEKDNRHKQVFARGNKLRKEEICITH